MRLHITLARAGTLVFTALLTITILTAERTPADAATASAPVRSVAVRPIMPTDLLEAPTLSAPEPVAAVLGVETAPAPVAPPPPAPVVTASAGSYVLASWYGPGFYGNRTACGQTYSPQILGVAHKTLPCGTLLVLSYGGRSVTVPVIDRGPYVAGRTLDLSNATRASLGCPDLCTLLLQYAR